MMWHSVATERMGPAAHTAGRLLLRVQPAESNTHVESDARPGYYWVDGYWSQDSGRHTWIAGYWHRQPFSVAPHSDDQFNDRDNGRDSARSFDQERDRG